MMSAGYCPLNTASDVPANQAAIFEPRMMGIERQNPWRGYTGDMFSTMPMSALVLRAHRLHRQPVTQQQMMAGLISDAAILHARREHTALVTEHRRHPRLVVSGDRNDAIAQSPRHDLRIVGEAIGGISRQPATVATLQFRRQIPVIQRRVRLNVAFQQAIDQSFVEREIRSDSTSPVPSGCTRGQEIEKRYAVTPRSAMRSRSDSSR